MYDNNAKRPRVLITAGPTAEDIDPVRFITNRSSGHMGMELAAAVIRAGGTPLLILGPTAIKPPEGVTVVPVRSAADMCAAVTKHLEWADSLIMAAAVADYTPAEPLAGKLKKTAGDLYLRLKRTTDILAHVKNLPERSGRFIVGFSLDVDVNLAEGKRKLHDKNLDLIVVNGVSSFASDSSTACLMTPETVQDCGGIRKHELADVVISHIIDFLKK